jgi:hypothetical protein
VRVAVRYRTAAEGRAVRPPTGGAPPSVLSVSSFKLQALKDVDFSAHTWNQSAEIMTAYFDIAPKRLPNLPQNLKTQYESLWTHEEMDEERDIIQSKVPDAIRVAAGLTRSTVYRPLMQAVDDRFADRGLPLHPGEVRAIAKMMTYTLDEGMDLEPGFHAQESRWFQTLCQLLASDPRHEYTDRGELAVKYLFDSALYDAIILGFSVIAAKVREDLGDSGERISYANRVLLWLSGQGEPDLSYVYLPLVLGGVVVNQFVTTRDDNPWVLLSELREAYHGRRRLVSGEAVAIFNMLDLLLTQSDDALRRARVPLP